MSKKRNRPLPENMYLPNGAHYKLVIFEVISKDYDGVAVSCRLWQDKHTIHLTGGTEKEFITAYIPAVMLLPEHERPKDSL